MFIIIIITIVYLHINFNLECSLIQLGCKLSLKVGTVTRLTLAMISSYHLRVTTKSIIWKLSSNTVSREGGMCASWQLTLHAWQYDLASCLCYQALEHHFHIFILSTVWDSLFIYFLLPRCTSLGILESNIDWLMVYKKLH